MCDHYELKEKENSMSLAEKLRFLADRAEDEKEFYMEDRLLKYEQLSTDIRLLDIFQSTLKLKPQWEFTEEEKTILRNIDDRWKWIARDEGGTLFLYNAEPYKQENYWEVSYDIYAIFNIYKHLFQSVQWSDDDACEFRKYI